MYLSYTRFSHRKHELTSTSLDSRDINPQDSDRRPSKASLILGTVATVDLQDVRPSSSSGHFNPRSKRYRLCCCAHVKTFTIAAGIVEIFVVCFLIVAVLPDLSSKLCTPTKEDAAIEELLGNENITIEQNNLQFLTLNTTNSSIFLTSIGLDKIQQVSCSIGIGWFFWAFIHIVSVNFLFYGCKNNKWKLLFPHLFIRFALVLVVILIIALLIIVLFNPITDEDVKPSLIIIVFMASLLTLFLIFLTATEIRCLEFVKKSAETGFSTTVARSIGGAPTITMSDGQQVAMPPPTIGQPEMLKFEEESQPVTLPSPSPTPSNGAQINRRLSQSFSENPLSLRNLPPLRHTYKPG